jgi:molecular chaperone DnaK (HSP70)
LNSPKGLSKQRNAGLTYALDHLSPNFIAFIDSDDLVTVIPNKKGALTTPSAVYFDDEGKMLVGKAAKAHLADKPENTVVFIKREMSNKDFTVSINGKNYDIVI